MKLNYSKPILMISIMLMFIGCASSAVEETEAYKKKPTQHIKVADLHSMDEAEKIFLLKTSEIKAKTKLDVNELQEIHFITYTLEKSVAYFAENLTGERQAMAKELAEIVEEIHINSEDNLKEETKQLLEKYFAKAESFIVGF